MIPLSRLIDAAYLHELIVRHTQGTLRDEELLRAIAEALVVLLHKEELDQ